MGERSQSGGCGLWKVVEPVAVAPTPVPSHEGEGDDRLDVSVLVSLPLVGRGQGWGAARSSLADNHPSQTRGAVVITLANP